MTRLLTGLTLLPWLLYLLVRWVDPRLWLGPLEPVGTVAAWAGLIAGPLLAASVLPMVLLWRIHRRRLHLAGVVVSALAAGAVLAPTSWRAAPAGAGLTVLTWNAARLGAMVEELGKAEADYRKARTTSCIAAHLQALSPDVLMLTEVSRYDVEEILAGAFGDLSARCVHAPHDAGKQLSAGTLLCAWSRYLSLESSAVVEVPMPDGLHDQQFPVARFSGEGGRLMVAGVHLPPLRRAPERWPPWSRAGLVAAGQADMAAAAVAALDRDWPGVLAGDFNQTRHTWTSAALRSTLVDTHEAVRMGLGYTRLLDALPAARSLAIARVDYIYAAPERLQVLDAQVVRAGCTDHDPVRARLRQR